MNRRGELEKAMAEARMRASDSGLFYQLARRCDHNTGEIPDTRYAPRLPKLTTQAKISRAQGFVSLAHLILHGWFERYDTDDRGKVAGLLKVGRDCDCAVAVAASCKGCGKSLAGRRWDAKWCSDRCRMAAARRSVSPTSPNASGLDSPNSAVQLARTTGPAKPNTVRLISRTPVQAEPNKPQVRGGFDAVRAKSSNENEKENGVRVNEPECVPCGAPVSSLRAAQTMPRFGWPVCVRCEEGINGSQ